MIVLIGVVGTGIVGALAGWAMVRHWPRRHLDAPRLATNRISHLLSSHHHVAAVVRRDVDPGAAATLVLAAALLAIVVVAAAVGLLHLAATTDELTGRTDAPLALWAAEHSTERATEAIVAISWLGGTSAVVLVALVVAAVELRRTWTWMIPGFLVLTVGGQFAIVNGIKQVVDRARPDLLRLSGFAGTSFPSGHAAAAAATFAAAAMLLGRRRSLHTRAVLAGAATGVACAVAATRVALGVHWLTDVTAGLAVGWGWFALCSIAVGGDRLHFGDPVEVAERLADEER